MFKKENWVFSWRDCGITILLFAAATFLCILLKGLSENEIYVSLLFVLCVLMVSLLTEGYLCGALAALMSVLAVNYVFTYPYMKLNFSISGYPLTFVTMLAVAISVSTLTTNLQRQEKIRMESERERMRANLLRAISHDLRTPLTAISGSAHALLESEGLTPEQQKNLLTGIGEDAEWLIRMVENLLSVTRIGLEEAKIAKTAEVGEEVVYSAIAKLRKRFPEAVVTAEMPEDVLVVPMDPVLIEQVLVNLLENAVLHGRAREICVRLESNDGEALFTVEDNGTGIEKERFSHLFEELLPRQRREENNTRQSMGIGLSVCMSIVRAHGGSMSARNRNGGGASFSFSLPLEKE